MRKFQIWLMGAALSLAPTLQHCHAVVRINSGGIKPPAPQRKHPLGSAAHEDSSRTGMGKHVSALPAS